MKDPIERQDAPDTNVGDMISRQAAIDCVKASPINGWVKEDLIQALETTPPAQPEDWMEQNKDRILKAGMEGREVEFRIGGRLFAIREKAQ